MKFLIDQQLPATLATWFEARGYEAIHVRDIGMRDAPDASIWRHAIDQGWIIVTKDEDFALRRASFDGPQILWLRIGNSANRVLRAHLDRTWSLALPSLESREAIVEV